MSLFSCKDIDGIFTKYCSIKDKSKLSKVNKYYFTFYRNDILPFYNFYNKLRTTYKKISCAKFSREHEIFLIAVSHKNINVIEYIYKKYNIQVDYSIFASACDVCDDINIIKWLYNIANMPRYSDIIMHASSIDVLEFLLDKCPSDSYVNEYIWNKIIEMRSFDVNGLHLIWNNIKLTRFTSTILIKSCKKFEYFDFLTRHVHIDVTDFAPFLIDINNLHCIDTIFNKYPHNYFVQEETFRNMCKRDNFPLFKKILLENYMNIANYTHKLLSYACEYGNYKAVKLIDSMFGIKKYNRKYITNTNIPIKIEFTKICKGGSLKLIKMFINRCEPKNAHMYLKMVLKSNKYNLFVFLIKHLCEYLIQDNVKHMIIELLCYHGKIDIIKANICRFNMQDLETILCNSLNRGYIHIAKYVAGFIDLDSINVSKFTNDIELWLNTKDIKKMKNKTYQN